MIKFLTRWSGLIILTLGLILFFYFDLHRYLSFQQLKENRHTLVLWTQENYVRAAVVYLLIYMIVVAFSIPGGALLTVIGGFLFGIFFGTLFAVLAATIGATCVFLAVRTALEPWLAKKTNRWIQKMRSGFQKSAFQYLLFLRLIPLFPFWVVNIVPALLGVRLSTFFFATFIGIIPGTIVYASIGNGLGFFFDQNKTPNLKIIFAPQIFIPLIFLAMLVIFPNLFRFFKKK